MNKNVLAKASLLVVWIYKQVLHLYPQQFRKDYAVQMEQVFRDVVRDAIQERGWAGLIYICWKMVVDVLRSFLYQHYTTIMEISPRKLASVSSFGAFYFAAIPLWALAVFYIGRTDFYAPLLWLGIPAFWGLPVMVLGISGKLLPEQRFTSVPYLAVSTAMIGYIILFASIYVVDADIVRSWGITTTVLNRLFWVGISLLGVMAWSQREKLLGGILLGVAALYFITSLWISNRFSGPLLLLMVAGGFTYVGIWLRRKKEVSVSRAYTLSWWTVALQALILVLGVAGIIVSTQRPIQDTEAYKMTVGFRPAESIAVYDDEARDEIEAFIGKPLPPSSHDMRFEYSDNGSNKYSVLIRFSAEPEEAQELIESGLLCFKKDLGDVVAAQAELSIDEVVMQQGWQEQKSNPWVSFAPWGWARNSSHIKGFCPLPSRYVMDIFESHLPPESWWISISGGNR